MWPTSNAVIEQWLRGNERTWRATDFRPPPDSAETIPVWLSLYDADSFLYGGDDHADLHPDYRRRNVGIIYPLGTVVERTTVGGSAWSGSLAHLRRRSGRDPLPHRDDRDGSARRRLLLRLLRRRHRHRLRHRRLRPHRHRRLRRRPPDLPDLVITDLGITTFTVSNQGTAAAAGPFSVLVTGFPPVSFTGLAAGAQATRHVHVGVRARACARRGRTI